MERHRAVGISGSGIERAVLVGAHEPERHAVGARTKGVALVIPALGACEHGRVLVVVGILEGHVNLVVISDGGARGLREGPVVGLQFHALDQVGRRALVERPVRGPAVGAGVKVEVPSLQVFAGELGVSVDLGLGHVIDPVLATRGIDVQAVEGDGARAT